MASPKYKPEDQPWYGPIPHIKDKGAEALDEAPVDVILLSAVPFERDAVLRLLRPLPNQPAIYRTRIDKETYYLGQFGIYKAVVTMCEMGTTGRGSSILATNEAILKWVPRAVIMAGFAYGKDPEKQNIADILVSSQVINCGPKRIEKRIIYRGARVEPGQTLLNRFRNVIGWQFKRPDGSQCNIIIGPLLSEEDLIDNPEHKQSLLEQFPDAIGGEMEGAGVYASADRQGVEWIIIKGICDWADGNKDKGHQPLAAAAAMSLVHFVLSGPDALPARRVVINETASGQSRLSRTAKSEGASDPGSTSEQPATAQWAGVVWNGKFIACDGPLEHLRLIEDEVFQQSMADMLASAGYRTRLARQDKLSSHAQKGYRIVHLTDQKSWRRRIVQSRLLLIARLDGPQSDKGAGAGSGVEVHSEKQPDGPDNLEAVRDACYRVTKRIAKLLIDDKPVIPRHGFRTKLNEFLSSSFRYCFILGPSGVGKSVVMAVEALRLFDLRWSSLLMPASSFSIDEAYKSVCEEMPSGCSAATFRQFVKPMIGQEGRDSRGLVIFIDAIDDSNPDRIASELSRLHETIGDLPTERLKVVISCRDTSWEGLKNDPGMPIYQQAAPFGLASINTFVSVELSDFSPAELDSALEEIGAEDLLIAGHAERQDDYHVRSLRELLAHPARFGHYANLKSSADRSLIQDLTWSTLIERSMEASLKKPARRCRALPENLREQLIRLATLGWEAKARGFTLDKGIIKINLPDMLTRQPEADLSPYAALLDAGILVETETPDGNRNTAFRVTDVGAYYLSIELERRLTDRPIDELRVITEEWLRDAWNYSPSLDAVLAWIDRLADRPYDPRLLNLIELIINSYHFHRGPLFGLVRPVVVASIFEIVKREDLKDFYAFREAARGIRYSAEAIRIIRDHLKDPNPQVRELATELVGIHGDIESKGELLNLFADSDEEVRSEVYGAFRRFGTRAIETLIEVANDPSKEYELRAHCLGALRGIGYRDDRVSALIRRCLSSAGSGNPDLLKNAFLLAAHMRDKGHTNAATTALRHESLDVVHAAAKYLAEVPDPAAFDALEEALRPQWLPSGERVKRYWVPRQLVAALFRTDPQKAEPIALEIMHNAFKGEGEFYPVEGVWLGQKLIGSSLYARMLEELATQLQDLPKHNLIWQAAETIGDAWQADILKALIDSAESLGKRRIDLARLFVDDIARGIEIAGGHRIADHLSRISDLRTVVKCRRPNLILEATRLLNRAKRWNLNELCNYLWIAGDGRAEQSLLNRLENPGSQDDTAWYEKSNLAKALATCGAKQSSRAILELMRTEQNLSAHFYQEALYPLVLRKVVRSSDLAAVVRDASYLNAGRTLSLLTLALLSVRRHKRLFVEAAGYSDSELLQRHGARLLGFTADPSLAPTLIQLLRTSTYQSVKSEAAEALGRLQARHAVHDIEHGLEEMPAPGFIKALAQFAERSSLPLILEGVQKGRGEFYENYLRALGAFWRFPEGREAIERQIAEWTRSSPSLFDDQTPLVAALIRHDPSLLLAQAVWLLDNGCLKSNARVELARSVPFLVKRKEVDKEALAQTIKRLACDRDVMVRELTVLSLHQVGLKFCRSIYSEISKCARSAEWDRACAAYAMAVCGNDTKQTESVRYHSEFLVRRAGDEAVAALHKRVELERHVDQFASADRLVRLSAYLCLEEHADLFSIPVLHRKCKRGSLSFTFLRSLTSEINNRLKKEYKERQEKESKLEQSRGTIWFD